METITLTEVRGKLSPTDAADKAGLSLTTWNGIETGSVKPSKALKSIAAAFRVIVEIHPNGNLKYRKP